MEQTKTKEDPYKEFKDKDGKYVRCPICESDKHTDGRCELQEYNYYENR